MNVYNNTRKPESIINEIESVIKNFPTNSVPEGFTGIVSINIPIPKHSLIEVL